MRFGGFLSDGLTWIGQSDVISIDPIGLQSRTCDLSAVVPEDADFVILSAGLFTDRGDFLANDAVTFPIATATPTPSEWFTVTIVSLDPWPGEVLSGGETEDFVVKYDYRAVTASSGAYSAVYLWHDGDVIGQTSPVFLPRGTGTRQSALSGLVPLNGNLTLRVVLFKNPEDRLAEDLRIYTISGPTATQTPVPTPTWPVTASEYWEGYR